MTLPEDDGVDDAASQKLAPALTAHRPARRRAAPSVDPLRQAGRARVGSASQAAYERRTCGCAGDDPDH